MANPYPATFVDENSETRLNGKVNFTDAANQPGPPDAGATVTLSGGATLSTGGVIPWDTASYDTNAFLNPVTYRLVVPTGLGGVYLYGVTFGADYFSGNPTATYCLVSVNVNGNPDNLYVFTPMLGAAYNYPMASGFGIERFAAGNNVGCTLIFDGGGTVNVQGGGNASQFFMRRLGT